MDKSAMRRVAAAILVLTCLVDLSEAQLVITPKYPAASDPSQACLSLGRIIPDLTTDTWYQYIGSFDSVQPVKDVTFSGANANCYGRLYNADKTHADILFLHQPVDTNCNSTAQQGVSDTVTVTVVDSAGQSSSTDFQTNFTPTDYTGCDVRADMVSINLLPVKPYTKVDANAACLTSEDSKARMPLTVGTFTFPDSRTLQGYSGTFEVKGNDCFRLSGGTSGAPSFNLEYMLGDFSRQCVDAAKKGGSSTVTVAVTDTDGRLYLDQFTTYFVSTKADCGDSSGSTGPTSEPEESTQSITDSY